MKYFRLDNMEVRRNNGCLAGHIRWDSDWEKYRFYPVEEFPLTADDLADIAKGMNSL